MDLDPRTAPRTERRCTAHGGRASRFGWNDRVGAPAERDDPTSTERRRLERLARAPLGPASDRPGSAAGGLAQGAPGGARAPWTAAHVARRGTRAQDAPDERPRSELPPPASAAVPAPATP